MCVWMNGGFWVGECPRGRPRSSFPLDCCCLRRHLLCPSEIDLRLRFLNRKNTSDISSSILLRTLPPVVLFPSPFRPLHPLHLPLSRSLYCLCIRSHEAPSSSSPSFLFPCSPTSHTSTKTIQSDNHRRRGTT